MDFLSVHVPSLKEICKRFVIKKGISRIDLPTTLAEEVEEMEGRMKSIFTGTFHRHTDFSVTNTLTIAWTQGHGQWELTIKKAHTGLVVAQENLVIKSGEENLLGKLGGEFFMLPGRTVTIFDFRLNFGTKTLRFNGMCSSSKDPHGSSLNIYLGFQTFRKMEGDTLYQILDRSGTVSEFNGQLLSMDGSRRIVGY